jgi:hypothetical protein
VKKKKKKVALCYLVLNTTLKEISIKPCTKAEKLYKIAQAQTLNGIKIQGNVPIDQGAEMRTAVDPSTTNTF